MYVNEPWHTHARDMSAMTPSYVCHDSSTCVTCIYHDNSFTCVPWLNVRHDSLTCVRWTVTHVKESWHTHAWDMSHENMGNITHVNETCRTHKWVTSRIWISHVTHILWGAGYASKLSDYWYKRSLILVMILFGGKILASTKIALWKYVEIYCVYTLIENISQRSQYMHILVLTRTIQHYEDEFPISKTAKKNKDFSQKWSDNFGSLPRSVRIFHISNL